MDESRALNQAEARLLSPALVLAGKQEAFLKAVQDKPLLTPVQPPHLYPEQKLLLRAKILIITSS